MAERAMIREPMPVFHIGANKAGSTTLQQALFARHPEVLSLAKPHPNADAEKAVDAIVAACDRRGSSRGALDVNAVRELWQRGVADVGGRAPISSHEELIRYYLYGSPDNDRLARTIVEIAGPVRVAIVVRHQLRLIESLYIHKANSSNYLPPDEWLASAPESFMCGYRFCEIAESWMRVVGEDNVGIFVFEELAADFVTFAKRLCTFIGIDADIGVSLLARQHENVRKSTRTQAYAKLRGNFFPEISFGKALPSPVRRFWRNYLEGGRRARVDLPPVWLDRISEYYSSDNRRLAERFHLPLQAYGYPM